MVLATTAFAIGAATAAAAAETACIELSRLERTTAIDDRTIVAALKPGAKFRKIGLAGPCGGLKFHNAFGFATPEPRVCAGQSITVIRTGSVCSIATISELSAADAEDLLTKS